MQCWFSNSVFTRGWVVEPLRRQARVLGNQGTGYRGLGGLPWLLPEGQRTRSSAHVDGVLLCGSGHRACPAELRDREDRRPVEGGTACRFPTPSPAGGGQCDSDSRTCHAHAEGAPHPRSSDGTRHAPPVQPAQSHRRSRGLGGQPGGVACGEPAPLMCAGAAVIGWALVTCGDCGGPGCCGCRSARRGSSSGSPAFKGDAEAAPGMGGRWKGRNRSRSSTVPRDRRDA